MGHLSVTGLKGKRSTDQIQKQVCPILLQALFKNRLTTKLTNSFKSMSRAAGNIQTGRLHAFACINIASATLPRSWVNKDASFEVLLGPSHTPSTRKQV